MSTPKPEQFTARQLKDILTWTTTQVTFIYTREPKIDVWIKLAIILDKSPSALLWMWSENKHINNAIEHPLTYAHPKLYADNRSSNTTY